MQVNIASLEQVVKEYLALAEAKTEAARKKSAQAVLETTMVDDLDQVSTSVCRNLHCFFSGATLLAVVQMKLVFQEAAF